MPYDLYDEDEDDYVQCMKGRKRRMPLGPSYPHYPNKTEGKELRRLMSKSGETEEQIRAKVENRRKLAAAQKSPMQRGPSDRAALELKRTRRNIAARLGVPTWDPAVEAALDEKDWCGRTPRQYAMGLHWRRI